MDFSLTPYGGFSNYGSSPYMYNQSTIGLIGGGLLAFGVMFITLYVVLAWIFRSIGLYHMAKSRGIPHAWFAWVPFLSQYVLGRLINNKVVLGDDIVVGHASFFLPLLSLLAFSVTGDEFSGATGLLTIFSVCVWVYQMSALWRLFKIYRPAKRVSYTIWSAILTAGFFIFAIRDDKPFDELEPNRVYENYYSGKDIIDREYQQERAEIRAREEEDKKQLRAEYESQLNQESLTPEKKDEMRDNYYEERAAITREADENIKKENREYQQELQAYDDSFKQETNPAEYEDPSQIFEAVDRTAGPEEINFSMDDGIIPVESEQENSLDSENGGIITDYQSPAGLDENIDTISQMIEDQKYND